MTPECFDAAAIALRHRAHVLRVRAGRTHVRERNALRARAARLERAATVLDEEAAIPATDYQLPEK